MSTLDLSFEEVFEHLARGDARGVEEGDVVERRGQHVREAEGQHERDPSYAPRCVSTRTSPSTTAAVTETRT